MKNFIQKIKKTLYSTSKNITIVYDPDELLKYEEIRQSLKDDGCYLYYAENQMEIRILYELKLKRNRKNIIATNKVFELLPDINKNVLKTELSLKKIFPFFESEMLGRLGFLNLSKLAELKVYKELNKKETKKVLIENGIILSNRDGLEKQNFLRILQELDDKHLAIQNRMDDWLEYIKPLSKLILQYFQLNDNELRYELDTLISKVNEKFQVFLEASYETLYSLSFMKRPVIVTRVLDYIRTRQGTRKALIVLDGMNHWQWFMIESYLLKHGFNSRVQTIFAFIPSITAWSRQAIFKGSLPDMNLTNPNEKKLFINYWKNNKFFENQISYNKFTCNQEEQLDILIHSYSIVSFVCNDLDDLMHGITLGNEQLYESTNLWLNKNKFLELIQCLKENNFQCFITSDHGNIEAKGFRNFTKNEGIGKVSRSKRHIQFLNNTILNSFLEKNNDLSLGKKENSIYLKDNLAFTDKGTTTITHGGSHILEVLIPFVEI